jgi:hypothetical protein
MDLGEEAEQVEVAVRMLLGLLRMQAERPGSIPLDYLPTFILMTADERERQGDFGAARLMHEWAGILKDWDQPEGATE